jgi:hypothetical protein
MCTELVEDAPVPLSDPDALEDEPCPSPEPDSLSA